MKEAVDRHPVAIYRRKAGGLLHVPYRRPALPDAA